MKNSTSLLSVIAVLALGACNKDEAPSEPAAVADTEASEPAPAKAAPEAPEPAPAEIAVDELDKLIAAKAVAVFDANGDSTREKYGKIPGAKLLSGSDWSLDVLPEDKAEKLVFYCSNTMCSAGPNAAKKAMLAGYSDVNVLKVGIAGWKDAGKSTEPVSL